VELKDKLDDFAVAPVRGSVQGAAVDDVLSALTNLGYQRPAAEKAIEQAVAKDAALAGISMGCSGGAEGDSVRGRRAFLSGSSNRNLAQGLNVLKTF